MGTVMITPFRITLYILYFCLLFCITGCIGFHRMDPLLSVSENGPSYSRQNLKGKTLYVRSFEHKEITDITTIYVIGARHSAGGLAVTTGKSETTPLWFVRSLEDTNIFSSVIPSTENGSSANYVLEGYAYSYTDDPFWTYLQLIDLWIHAWFFPTMGRDWITKGEFSLYDRKRTLLHRWKFENDEKYMGTVWWMIEHGQLETELRTTNIVNEIVRRMFLETTNIK